MTKAIRQALQDAYDSGVATVVYCMRVERTDGAVFRFTSHSDKLTMSNGAVYVPDQASPDETAVSASSDLSATTFDLEGALTANGVSRDEIAAGLFDFADLYLFRTLWDDPVEDDEELAKGLWGKSEIKDRRYVNEFRGVSVQLEQTVGRVHSALCDAELGDSRCNVRLEPPEWQASTSYTVRPDADAGAGSVIAPTTQNGRHFQCVAAGTSGSSEPTWDTTIGNTTSDGGVEWQAIRALSQVDTVQSVTSRGEFTGALGFPDDWFGSGLVRFTSGANAGLEKEVDSYVADTYTLWQSFPFTVAVGDTFVAIAGCRKRFQNDCVAKFDNAHNNRSFPHLPGQNQTLKFGGQQ